MTPSRPTPTSLLRTLWRILSFQWPRKLASLALAVFVWFVATGDRRSALERTLEVPVQVIDRSSAEERTVSGLPRTVRVTLYGSRERLESLLPERVEAAIDLSSLDEGSFEARVTVRPPAETELRRLEPERVSGVIDATVSRTFTVQPALSDPSQNPLVGLRVTPAQVTVRGSRRQLDRVQRVTTVPVSLEGENPGESYLLAVAPTGGVVTGVQFSPGRVRLERLLLPGTEVKTVPVRLAPDPAWTVANLSFAPARVRLVGPAPALSGIAALELRVALTEGPFTLTPTPTLPPGVAVLERVQVRGVARRTAGD